MGDKTDPRPSLGQTLPVPVVYAYAPSDDPRDTSVVSDNVGAGRLAANHVLVSGRRRIGYIAGDPQLRGRPRPRRGRHGAADARQGSSWSEARRSTAPGPRSGAAAWPGSCWSASRRLDAVLCGSDQIARGVIDALRELGRDIPSDIAVMGHDNWEPLATQSRPPLSTIDMNLETLGRTAAQRLFQAMEGVTDPSITSLPCRVVSRGSTDMTLSPTLTMNTGAAIPQLGFGVWQIERDGERVIGEALEVGYRHLDTAMIYHNEREVGRAIAASAIPRDELFVTTKLFNTDHGTQEAYDAFDASLERLGLDYVDLYLIHWPMPGVDRYVESWRALETIAASGRTKAIGVSNFMPEHLQRLFDETGTVPAVNQIEVHPEHQQTEASRFGIEHGIITESYSPLANGRILDDPRSGRHRRCARQVRAAGDPALARAAGLRRHPEDRAPRPDDREPRRVRLRADRRRSSRPSAAFERGGRVGNDPRRVNGP